MRPHELQNLRNEAEALEATAQSLYSASKDAPVEDAHFYTLQALAYEIQARAIREAIHA